MSIKDKVIVALDVQSKQELERLTSKLEATATYVKVGMELFYTFGPKIIKDLQSKGFKVFLDLKIHDIPNTAKKSAKTITKLGASIINVHAAGGIEMMKAAKEGVEEALLENSSLKKPLLIAVTQLTSTTEQVLKDELLVNSGIETTVVQYAKNAKAAGLDGVVSSPLEVKLIKESIGPDFLCITPGIRLKGTSNDDQKRITTPIEAIELGSDYLVIGRAITRSESPSKAYKEIIKGLE